VADFSGVCSGDIYVLEPRDNYLLPELLPFICQADEFLEHAVGTSAGSLSPRTNWESLANYEFSLPPLEEQRRAASAMWANEMQRRAYRSLAESSKLARRSLAASLFTVFNHRSGLQRLGDAVVHSAYGPRFAASKYVDSGNAWTIRTTDFCPSGGIDYSSVPVARLDEEVIADHRLLDGDFLLSRSGEYAGMVRVFDALAAPNRPYIPAAFLIRFRLMRQRLLPRFLLEYLESVCGEMQLKRIAQGSAQPNISGSAFMNLHVPIPSLATQESVCKHLKQARKAEIDTCERLLDVERLSRKILELVLTRCR
jgi:type I restriction enzyme S subunit